MYNRYDGNSGRYVRVDDTPAESPPTRHGDLMPPQKNNRRGGPDALAKLIPNAIADLDTEDVILILVLYLMYRESGDKDLLIMMGSLFLP